MSRKTSLKACHDGRLCPLQYKNPFEHNSLYSHPCRWSELCRDQYQNSEHAQQFTHARYQTIQCRYGSENCNRITDPEHRHDGLPDFLIPCRFKEQCRDHSIEHLKKYEHPPDFYEQQTQTPTLKQYPRKYASERRNQSISIW